MLMMLMRLLTFDTMISGLLKLTGSPLNRHTILTGESPLTIEQVADTISPEFAGPSLIAKGATCGGTIMQGKRNEDEILVNTRFW